MSNYRRGRDAEYAARNLLQEKGYSVVRSAGSKTPFDLIAWNSEDLFFLQIKRTATPPSAKGIGNRYKKEIEKGEQTQRPGRSRFQLWVMVPKYGWWRYEILPGGLMEVPGLVA
jgi:hypothetical protein